MIDKELEKKALDAIIRARVQLLLKQPFFGVLATYLEPKSAQLPSYAGGMGTDGRFLYFQPDKLMNLLEKHHRAAQQRRDVRAEEIIETIIAHEVLHCSLLHIYRRENRDLVRWNVATDFAVNDIVKQNFELPDWALYDDHYSGKCAEEIFNLLPGPQCPVCKSKYIRGLRYKSKKYKDGSYRIGTEFKCESCGHTWKEQFTREPGEYGGYPMSFDQIEGDFPTTLDDHSVWDGKEKADGLDSQTRKEKLAEEWKRRTIRAAQIAKTQGSVPAGLERFIEDLLYPKLGWRQLLWQYTTRVKGMKLNWRRPNKKLIQYGIYYPTKRQRRLEMAGAIDTSASISEQELREFLTELRGIISTFNAFRVRMLACDADVHADVTVTSLEDFNNFKVNVKGGGGTSFIPVFEALKNDSVQVLVYLTDGYGTYPEEKPGYDTIWVISKEGDPKRPPFGKVVELK